LLVQLIDPSIHTSVEGSIEQTSRMSEAKESKGAGRAAEDEPEEVINVTRIRFAKGSNNCALQAPLTFDVSFVCNRDLVDAHWDIKVRPTE
jgi:hypothetical protein